MTQLFGDRAMIGNATGCSSIYGGNLPTTPYTKDAVGRGPTWSNSLFEDAAEFGFGFRLGANSHARLAEVMLRKLAPQIGDTLVGELLGAEQHGEVAIAEQRQRVDALREKLRGIDDVSARRLELVADYLVRKSVWLMGGDGWAYDIGYGGLDHVMSTGRDVNILVLDTEVYSNTGGQASKSTPLGAAAKFAAIGKGVNKKDLGMMAMSYGHVYVASVAMGANDNHTVKAFLEADAYPGPSLIIAYSHCIAHGYDLAHGMEQQANAVASGYWPLFRYDPRLADEGQNPMQLDSKAPKLPLEKYIYNETRYTMLVRAKPEEAKALLEQAKGDVERRWKTYEHMANSGAPAAPTEPADKGGAA
jgi:pyruvate-ferredoxin/flavodoxin oxidoreductase